MTTINLIETPTVVFIDILGFAVQVIKDDGALPLLDAFYNSSHTFDDLAKKFSEDKYTTGIERLFGLFHVGMEEELAIALHGSHLHSIVFSDSAFVAFEHDIDALVFCQRVMRKMIRGLVPVRIGVAHGSFRPLRFKTDLGHNVSLHSSYFLGSGVVKAHAAESSGVSGLRILLHKDFPIPAGFEEEEIIPLAAPETSDPNRLRKFQNGSAVVDRELQYLRPYDPGAITLEDQLRDEDRQQMNYVIVKGVRLLQSVAAKDVRYHYDDTLVAIRHMRARMNLPYSLDTD